MDHIDIVDQAFSLGHAVVPSVVSAVDSTMWMYIGAGLLLAGIIAYFVFFSKPKQGDPKQGDPKQGDPNCNGGFCTMRMSAPNPAPEQVHEGTPI